MRWVPSLLTWGCVLVALYYLHRARRRHREAWDLLQDARRERDRLIHEAAALLREIEGQRDRTMHLHAEMEVKHEELLMAARYAKEQGLLFPLHTDN
jgi:hypothetical protein